MKKRFIFVALLLASISIWAQVPQKLSYQAVLRNANNELIVNQAVGLRISIIKDSATGTVVYQEVCMPNPSTNANGLVTIEIGGGTPVVGTFSAINWANGPTFIKTETDPSGGTAYNIVGTSPLLSVPYALYAAKTLEYPTGFSAYATISSNIIHNDYITFDAELYDDANAFSNSAYTAPSTGLYHFDASTIITCTNSPGAVNICFTCNGNMVKRVGTLYYNDGQMGLSITADLKLIAGDLVKVYIVGLNYGPFTTVVNNSSITWFDGHKIY